MSAAVVLSRLVPTSIDVVQLDASVSEVHNFEAEITDHPVESGFNPSDHMRPRPEVVQVEGIVTDTSLVADAGQGYDHSRSQVAFARFEKLRTDGQLVTLVTGLRTYTDMAIASLSIPRDARTAYALRFTMTLKRIRVIDNRMTRVTVSKDPRAGAKVSTGNQTTKPTDPEVESRGFQMYEGGKKDGFVGAVRGLAGFSP